MRPASVGVQGLFKAVRLFIDRGGGWGVGALPDERKFD